MDGEGVYRAAFWAVFGILLLIRLVFSLRVRQAGERLMPDRAAIRREGAAAFAFRAAAFFVLLAVLAAYALDLAWLRALNYPLPGWLRWIGCAAGLAGLGLLAWSQAELGRHWSAQLQLREEHHLVTTGPYRRVRHPVYTAMYALAAYFALLPANWIFLAFGLIAALGLNARVGREERMMIERFGEEYRAYMRRTGRFVPRLR